MERGLVHRDPPRLPGPFPRPDDLVVFARLRRRGPVRLAAQRGDPRDRVAEVVREVRVVALQERLVRKGGVLAECHLAKEEVSERVRPELFHQRVGLHDVPDRLRHLLFVAQPPAVRPHGRRHRNPRRQQEGRPVDRVKAEDVLADHVDPAAVGVLPELAV